MCKRCSKCNRCPKEDPKKDPDKGPKDKMLCMQDGMPDVFQPFMRMYDRRA